MSKLKTFIYLLFTSLFFANILFAADDVATPSKYEVTMKKVELCTSVACSETTVLAEKDGTFNIASSSAGADVGDWITSFALEVGTTYTHIRATLSSTFTIAGYTTNSSISSDYCVTASSPNTASGHAQGAIVAGSNSTSNADMSWIIPNKDDADNGDPYGDLDGNFDANNLTKTNGAATFTWIGGLEVPYTPSPSSTPKFIIKFDVTDQLKSTQQGADTCYMWIESPTVNVKVID